MMARRRKPMATPSAASTHSPASSGPRCSSAAHMPRTAHVSSSAAAGADTNPVIPHMQCHSERSEEPPRVRGSFAVSAAQDDTKLLATRERIRILNRCERGARGARIALDGAGLYVADDEVDADVSHARGEEPEVVGEAAGVDDLYHDLGVVRSEEPEIAALLRHDDGIRRARSGRGVVARGDGETIGEAELGAAERAAVVRRGVERQNVR